eukprot:COSAG06_NODE_30724_length_533_cov_1.380184_1_plen_69_part_10
MVQAAPARGVDLRLLATFIAPIRNVSRSFAPVCKVQRLGGARTPLSALLLLVRLVGFLPDRVERGGAG